MSGLRQQKKAKVKNQILEVSKKLFINNGYDKTSTKEITKTVGIGAGTLFNYFPTKADILIEILSDEINSTVSNNDSMIKEDVHASELVLEFLLNTIKPAMKFPRSIMREFIIASMSLLKKSHNIIEKIIDVDMSKTEELSNLLNQLKNKNLVKDNTDCTQLSRILFSSLFLEYSMYIFDDRYTNDQLTNNIKKSVDYLLPKEL